MFHYKKDSATGRLLIWETTMRMIAEKPILGWGDDSFRSQYMPHQANYFKNHPDSKYEILADNVVHPFNEYLLLTAEHGIVGLILLVILIFSIYRKQNKENLIFQLSILSILIFACFSYPFRYPLIWLILAYSLARLSNKSLKSYYQFNGKFNLLVKISVFLCILFCGYFLIKDIQFEYKWNELARQSLLGKTKTVMPQYEELHSKWNGNPLFFYNYGAELNYIKKYEGSTLILQECEKYYNDYDVQMLLADNYFNMKQWDNAEICYTNGAYMCPNRFLPLGKLINISDSIGRPEDAIKLANKIINKPVKVKSTTVYKIIHQAKKKLEGKHFDLHSNRKR